MLQDRGELTLLHLQPNTRLIKNSADVMHNGHVDTKIKQLPPRLLGGTWYLTHMEHCYSGRNLYQLKHRYGLLPCSMQEPFCLQLRRGEDFVQQQRRSMQQGQRKRRWCRRSSMVGRKGPLGTYRRLRKTMLSDLDVKMLIA